MRINEHFTDWLKPKTDEFAVPHMPKHSAG
jgi:hypothetical protein